MCNAEGVSLVLAEQRERQQRAAVDLKHHIDEAQAGLADKAEVHQTRAKQQADMHAREFNALLESGQNPYAVSRTWSLGHMLLDISLTRLHSCKQPVGTKCSCRQWPCYTGQAQCWVHATANLAACSQPADNISCDLTCMRTSASASRRHTQSGLL